ncbi:Ig-like domain-containing protein [Chloroflexota bacterium]
MPTRRLGKWLVLAASLLLLVLATSYTGPMQVAEGLGPQYTEVCGAVEGTWTVEGSPYVVTCDIYVTTGTTLTIQPGVVVKFHGWWDDLMVDGTLIADATAESPITFTSLQDDAVGGDTNGDGSATSPAPDDWSSLRFNSGSTGNVLDHTVVRYGGGQWSENVRVVTTDLTLTNNTIAHSSWHGLTLDNALPSSLSGNTIISNAQHAVNAPLTNNADSISLSGNSASGNGVNGVVLWGSVSGVVNWAWDGGDTLPFVVYGTVTVQEGSRLTLAPGTVLKFRDHFTNLVVAGGLVADATAEMPVIFTSLQDDSVGGDTNGDGSATSPAPGDWGGIQVMGDATLGGAVVQLAGYTGKAALRVESGAEVEFADGVVQDSRHDAVSVSGTGRLLLSGSRIEHNEESAVVVDGDEAWVHVVGSSLVENGVVGNPAGGVWNNGNATVVLGGEPGAGNAILANAGYGAYQVGTGTTMLATYNWWGDASGPYHPALNPGGLGEEVSDRVAFTPWLTGSNALPAEGLVELLAPLSFSPGETFNLGVQFHNVRTETLEDVVVVAHLPELSGYVLSTGGGVYRPMEHDVVWRLGDVAPGESLDALARIETAWGLPIHTWFGATALVAATNLPNPAVDLDAVLSYTPVTTLTQHYLTPVEIAAELAADPELAALLQEAEALGFAFYDTALSQTFADSDDLLTLVLLDRERLDQVVSVRRDGDERTLGHTTSAYATEYNDAGGWRYDLGTGEWSFWGAWAASTMGGSPTGGQPEEEPTDPCDPAYPKTAYDCRRNALIASFGGLMDKYQRDVNKGKRADSCLVCQRLGLFCDVCARKMTSIALGKRAAQFVREVVQKRCHKDQHSFDCDDDSAGCLMDSGSGSWYVRKELCDLRTCNYSGWTDYERCKDGAKCVDGCCKGGSTTTGASACYTQREGGPLLGLTIQGAESPCACEAGICSAQDLEARTGHDPNAKLGPEEASSGAWISYTVQYENLGAGTAYGVYVEDQLSPLLEDSTLQIEDGGIYFPSSRTIYWPVGELAPGAGGSLDFRVQVPTDAISGTVIMNSATVYFPSVPETTPTGDVVTLVQDLVAHSQRVETVEGVPLAITLTGHSPVGPLTYQIVAGPGSGTLTGTPPDVVYTPDPGFEGPDRFTFRVDDGLKESWPAEVSIVVHTGAEAVPPEVFATSPSRDEMDVQVSDTLVYLDTYAPSVYVYFTEPIDAATVTVSNLFAADDAGQHLAGYTVYDAGGYVARFVAQERFQKGATYTVTVTTGVRDTSGNALASDYVWSFTTETGPDDGWIYLPLVLCRE